MSLLSRADWDIVLISVLVAIIIVSFVLTPLAILYFWIFSKIRVHRAARRFVAELRAGANAQAIFRRQQERKAYLARKNDDFERELRGILNEHR